MVPSPILGGGPRDSHIDFKREELIKTQIKKEDLNLRVDKQFSRPQEFHFALCLNILAWHQK